VVSGRSQREVQRCYRSDAAQIMQFYGIRVCWLRHHTLAVGSTSIRFGFGENLKILNSGGKSPNWSFKPELDDFRHVLPFLNPMGERICSQ